MIDIVKNCKDPLVLVISPLLPEHDISSETKQSIRSNKIQYKWVSFASNRKHADNVQAGLDAYEMFYGPFPPYIMVLDRDIILGRKMIDRLYNTLIKQNDNVGYSYCPFEYRGHVNAKFPPMKFDIEKLKQANYISSNSLYKSSVVKAVGGFVTELKYHRLSDWAMWWRMYKKGYIGSICYDTSFIAMSTEKDISAGSSEEYHTTRDLIIQDFIS